MGKLNIMKSWVFIALFSGVFCIDAYCNKAYAELGSNCRVSDKLFQSNEMHLNHSETIALRNQDISHWEEKILKLGERNVQAQIDIEFIDLRWTKLKQLDQFFTRLTENKFEYKQLQDYLTLFRNNWNTLFVAEPRLNNQYKKRASVVSAHLSDLKIAIDLEKKFLERLKQIILDWDNQAWTYSGVASLQFDQEMLGRIDDILESSSYDIVKNPWRELYEIGFTTRPNQNGKILLPAEAGFSADTYTMQQAFFGLASAVNAFILKQEDKVWITNLERLGKSMILHPVSQNYVLRWGLDIRSAGRLAMYTVYLGSLRHAQDYLYMVQSFAKKRSTTTERVYRHPVYIENVRTRPRPTAFLKDDLPKINARLNCAILRVLDMPIKDFDPKYVPSQKSIQADAQYVLAELNSFFKPELEDMKKKRENIAWAVNYGLAMVPLVRTGSVLLKNLYEKEGLDLLGLSRAVMTDAFLIGSYGILGAASGALQPLKIEASAALSETAFALSFVGTSNFLLAGVNETDSFRRGVHLGFAMLAGWSMLRYSTGTSGGNNLSRLSEKLTSDKIWAQFKDIVKTSQNDAATLNAVAKQTYQNMFGFNSLALAGGTRVNVHSYRHTPNPGLANPAVKSPHLTPADRPTFPSPIGRPSVSGSTLPSATGRPLVQTAQVYPPLFLKPGNHAQDQASGGGFSDLNEDEQKKLKEFLEKVRKNNEKIFFEADFKTLVQLLRIIFTKMDTGDALSPLELSLIDDMLNACKVDYQKKLEFCASLWERLAWLFLNFSKTAFQQDTSILSTYLTMLHDFDEFYAEISWGMFFKQADRLNELLNDDNYSPKVINQYQQRIVALWFRLDRLLIAYENELVDARVLSSIEIAKHILEHCKASGSVSESICFETFNAVYNISSLVPQETERTAPGNLDLQQTAGFEHLSTEELIRLLSTSSATGNYLMHYSKAYQALLTVYDQFDWVRVKALMKNSYFHQNFYQGLSDSELQAVQGILREERDRLSMVQQPTESIQILDHVYGIVEQLSYNEELWEMHVKESLPPKTSFYLKQLSNDADEAEKQVEAFALASRLFPSLYNAELKNERSNIQERYLIMNWCYGVSMRDLSRISDERVRKQFIKLGLHRSINLNFWIHRRGVEDYLSSHFFMFFEHALIEIETGKFFLFDLNQ